MATAQPTVNDKLLAATAYLLAFVVLFGLAFGPLAIGVYVVWLAAMLGVFVRRRQRFVRFHAWQSIAVFSIVFAVILVFGYVPILGLLVNAFVSFAAFIVWIVLMWQAFQGVWFELPVLGAWSRRQEKRFAKLFKKSK